MKIIQYLPYSYHIHTGGLEKIAQTISDGLNQEIDTEVINIASDVRRGTGGDFNDYEDTLFTPSFDLVYNFPVPKFWTRSFWRQYGVIKNHQPDVIMTHTRFFVQSLVGGLIAKWLGCKRVHVEHGSGFVTGYPRYIKRSAWLFDWTIGLWILRQCNKIITISEMHKQFISKFTSKTPTVIYNPIDYQAQERIPQSATTALCSNECFIKGEQKIHIGFVGRLVSLKGVDILIQALKRIEDKDWICTIVGTGDQDTILQDLVDKKGLSHSAEDGAGRITFVGGDDRTNWLHKFDIFVNPSYQEGLPTTVVEALLAKCIVVATDIGGTREISNQGDLILCRSGDIEDLREKLEMAFNSLKKNGLSYERVQEKFGVKKTIQQYHNILSHNLRDER